MVVRLDAFRAAFDLEYAAKLTAEDWAAVKQMADWHIFEAENIDLLGPVMAAFPEHFNVAAQAQTAPRPIHEGPFSIIGKPQARLHGFGHVTGAGQYSEHRTEPGMVFMKTLLSRIRTPRSSASTPAKRTSSRVSWRSCTAATCPTCTRT
jgi:hypothetical protein